MPKISIIVPVYKINENYLRKCINSLVNQSLKDIEIIIIDDGSPDDCGDICDKYAIHDERIIVIHKKNEGVSVARNCGVDIASGDWITFVDPDDWCSLDMCEKILKEGEENNVEILIFGNYVIEADGKIVKNSYFNNSIFLMDKKEKDETEMKTMISKHPSFSYQIPNTNTGSTWGKLIKRDFIKQTDIHFEKELLRAQDIIFYINLFEKAEKIAYLDSHLYYYRVHATSAMNRYWPDIYKAFFLILQRQREFIDEFKKPKIFEEILVISAINIIAACMYSDYIHIENRKSFIKNLMRFRKMMKEEPMNSILNKRSLKSLITIQGNIIEIVKKFLLMNNMYVIYYILFAAKNNLLILKK